MSIPRIAIGIVIGFSTFCCFHLSAYAQTDPPILVVDSVLGSGESCPQKQVAYLSNLFFLQSCDAESRIWLSNGSPSGTYPLQARRPDQELLSISGEVLNALVVQNILYFNGHTDGQGSQLWRTNGTDLGTYMIADLAPFYNFSPDPVNFTEFQNQLFFFSSSWLPTDDSPSYYLWRTDGTAVGTVPISEILVRNGNYTMVVGNTLFFTADRRDDLSGEALFKTDGTAEGTVLVSNIVSDGEYSYIDNLTAFQGNLYFNAYTPQNGHELWRSDGTKSGTVMVKEGLPEFNGVYPRELTVRGNTLLYSGETMNLGRELWMSDGTEQGTILLRDIYSGTESSAPAHLFPFQSTIVFSADDGIHGAELWQSDGTITGTVLLKDIRNGLGSSSPSDFVLFNNLLYFVADDGAHGRELWQSDGTAAGTILVSDIYFGRNGSIPEELVVVDENLFFSAIDRAHGRELWRMGPTMPTYTDYLPIIANGELTARPTVEMAENN